jgi:hypothetical protein
MGLKVTRQLVVTDGWHPTINPSARMPIHHYRFVELLGRTSGLLNDLPRRQGGSTIRLVRTDSAQKLVTITVATGPKWMPWWLPSTDRRAAGLMDRLFDQAVASAEIVEAERRAVELLRTELRAQSDGDRSLGEALAAAGDRLFRQIDPNLPRLDLVRLRNAPNRDEFVTTLHSFEPNLLGALDAWATQLGKDRFDFLGIVMDLKGDGRRLCWSAAEGSLTTRPLDGRGVAEPVRESLSEWLADGRLLPASRLLALIEAHALLQGIEVIHFGNNYGRVADAANLLGASLDRFVSWPDDIDSWHYAVVQDGGGGRYPLHLLEVLCLPEKDRGRVPNLVQKSLSLGRPVGLPFRDGGGGRVEAVLD